MKMMMREKILCYILAVLVFLWGISVGVSTENSSFSRAIDSSKTHTSSICSTQRMIDAVEGCTLNMITKNVGIGRSNASNSMVRWPNRAVQLFLSAGLSLQYLFYYQSAECKEDGQLISNRTAIVDYIRLKDSGE